MPQRSYSSAVEEIKSRCNIVDIISPVVPLKRSGSNWAGCCPFHKEKTPSFMVSESRQTFHCFGCGAGGDAITFTMRYYNLEFPEAVEKLAAQYGIQIDTEFARQGKRREPYYDVNTKAARFFFKELIKPGCPGYAYISGRGISDETIKTFGLGYADGEWGSMTEALLRQGADRELMKELGLCKVSARDGKRLYDKYRDRVMFPIINTQGKIIGFGGRIIKDEEPKYLNSDESVIFRKKDNLYGLNLSRTEIQKEGYAVLVEGYMDVISLYQSGVRNVAASLGTALTDEQAKLLARYTKKVVLCYDADAAGIKAALRGIDVLRNAGVEVRVLHVDDGKDPDEYVKKHGRDAFLELIERKAMPDVDYRFSLIARKYDVNDTQGSVRFFKAAVDVLRTLPPVEADIYIKKLSTQYGVSEGAIRSELERHPKGAGRSPAYAQAAAPPEAPDKAGRNAAQPSPSGDGRRDASRSSDSELYLEMTVIRLILLRAEYYAKSREHPELFISDEGLGIKNAFESQYVEGSEFDPAKIREALDEGELAYLDRIMKRVLPPEDDARAFADCVSRAGEKARNARIEEIKDILSMAQGRLSKEDMNALTMELSELSGAKGR